MLVQLPGGIGGSNGSGMGRKLTDLLLGLQAEQGRTPHAHEVMLLKFLCSHMVICPSCWAGTGLQHI